MLDRAAGCLENAGRRLLQDSPSAIRSQTCLPRRFWRRSAAVSELPPWSLDFLQTATNRTSPGHVTASSASEAGRDSHAPLLDFLYPLRALELATSLAVRPSKENLQRRKRQSLRTASRPYSSSNTSEAATVPEHHDHDITSTVKLDDLQEEDVPISAKEQIAELLPVRSVDGYDRAWAIYAAAGKPHDVDSELLGYLSESDRAIDQSRAQVLFDRIPVQERSAEDYAHIVKSRLRGGSPSETEIKAVCEEAFSRELAQQCWPPAFAYHVNHGLWSSLPDMWNLRRVPVGDPFQAVRPFLDISAIAENLLGLASFVEKQNELLQGGQEKKEVKVNKKPGSLPDILDKLTTYAFRSSNIVQAMTTEQLLRIIRKLDDMGMLKRRHFSRLMDTLLGLRLRPMTVRAMVVYRTFRMLLGDSLQPPTKTIHFLMKNLAASEITRGIHYLLEEYAHFNGKVDFDVYQAALVAFSRAGEVDNVHQTFDDLVRTHGKPSALSQVVPLLYVYAKSGVVSETARQFRRIEHEFGLVPNVVCWNTLLAAHANAADIQGAQAVFEQMLANPDGMVDSYSFGTIMGLCANRGDIDAVHHLLALAKRRQVKVTFPMLDTVVEAYCNNSRLDLAEAMAEACLTVDAKGSPVRMWNLLLWNYAYRIDLEAVNRIRSRMEQAGIKADHMTYAALMLTLVLARQTDAARRILRDLHRSHVIYAMEVHYAIILYGYVRARNRDMIHIVYEEISERFGSAGPSSRLLRLKGLLYREPNAAAATDEYTPSDADGSYLDKAERFLEETIGSFDPMTLSRKHPTPGAGRRPFREKFPATFYEQMIKAHTNAGSTERAEQLFEEYAQKQNVSLSPTKSEEIPTLGLLAALMQTHLRTEQYEKVEECWRLAFDRAVQTGRDPNIHRRIPLAAATPAAESVDATTAPQPVVPQILLTGTRSSDIPEVSAMDAEPRPVILPSYRWILVRCLTLYMRSLGFREEAFKLPELVAMVESAGFELASVNWTTYVQMLATSPRVEDQIQAFAVFEKQFMPNFPGWPQLKRGFGLRPVDAPMTVGALDPPRTRPPHWYLGKRGRRHWMTIQPNFMQPTYVSLVYLAAALLAIRQNSITEGDATINALYSAAPRTVDAIAAMPYLRDKFQGVLLRGRARQGDRNNLADEIDPIQPAVWTGGVLGVGGRLRPAVDIDDEPLSPPDTSSQSSAEETSSGVADIAVPLVTEPSFAWEEFPESERILERSDAFDLEAETLLSRHYSDLPSIEEEDEEEDDYPLDDDGTRYTTRFGEYLEGILNEIEVDCLKPLSRQDRQKLQERRIRRARRKAHSSMVDPDGDDDETNAHPE